MSKNYNIAVLKGDGIGPEIVNEAIKVLDVVSKKCDFTLSYEEFNVGGIAYELEQNPFPNTTKEGCLKSDAVLFGAIGGPKWDNLPREMRPESGLLNLRKTLGTFANLRPTNVFDELVDASTLKREVVEGVDLLVVRELTGGIYFGTPKGNDGEKAFSTMVYTKDEIVRIAKVAFESARKRDNRVCSVDKANVLEVSQLWRDTVDEVAKDYSDVELTHMLVDNCAMQLVRDPKQFDIILTSNLFGDILSDEASMISGSIGLLPSASIGGKVGLYEPIHGSAPDIAGESKANPIATILSASMMLRYAFSEIKAADMIDDAVKKALKQGYRTGDIAKFGAVTICNTSEMGDVIASLVV